ncbi:MAG: hypothetical protein R3Y06_08015 [Faecalibacterium sp.]
MDYKKDVAILRCLARKYAEIAQDDSNGKLRILHRAVNDLQMIRPVVLIDDLPWGELNINGELTLQCQDKDFRTAETYMRQTLYRFYHFRADMIVRPYIPVEKIIHSTGYGIEIQEETIQHNGDTHIVSHEYQDQFADCEGLEKLHKCVITYDEEATNQIYYKIANAIGDIIPVKKTGQNYLSAVTWDNIAEYRIVEQIPNLRKISITPWADVNVAAQAIGKKYVMAAKPNPASVAMGVLDKAELRKEVMGIVDACYKNGCAFDFALKDISTVGHNPNVVTEWEEIVMDIITHY